MDLDKQTTAVIDQASGDRVTLPTVLLSDREASVLGQYESWLSRERLSRRLTCKDCGVEAETHVEPNQIGVLCQHRLLFYQGPVPVSLTEHPDAGEMLISPVRVTIPDVPIGVADAWILRQYRTFLQTYGLQEALWCLTCEDEGNAPGLRAYVTPTEISFMCRHANRVHRGLTV